MNNLIDKLDLGAVPAWISAVVTSFAFLVAALSYRRSVKVRHEEQARLVYSKILDIKYHEAGARFELLANGAASGAPASGATIVAPPPGEKACYKALEPVIQLTASIHNGSKELIGPAKLQVVNVGRKTTYDTFAVQTGVVDPESDYVAEFVWSNVDHPGQPHLGTTLLFRDASGQWWRRHRAEPIEAVHDDPENAAYVPAMRAAWAANARAMGSEPTPEPTISLRVRSNRLWRRLRGKTPTP